MGIVKNITLNTFPKQRGWVGKRVKVCFHYNTEEVINGTIVRDDEEEPGLLIIKLDDDRYVLATECMYNFLT